MAHFSKTGSRNMAETRAIDFLTLVSYSTTIVIWGLQQLLLPFLISAGPDFENCVKNRQVRFSRLFLFLTTRYRKSRKPRETIFGSLVVG